MYGRVLKIRIHGDSKIVLQICLWLQLQRVPREQIIKVQLLYFFQCILIDRQLLRLRQEQPRIGIDPITGKKQPLFLDQKADASGRVSWDLYHLSHHTAQVKDMALLNKDEIILRHPIEIGIDIQILGNPMQEE